MISSLGVLLILLLTQLPWIQADCSNNVLFLRHPNEALLGHVIKTIEENYMTCIEKCIETNGCRSVNFCRDNNGKETCELNRSSKTLRPDSIVSYSSCEYNEITRRDDCTSQVCLDKHLSDRHRFNSSLFLLVKDRMTWNEARIFCQSLQGDLASIASQQEKHSIDSTLLPATPQGNVTETKLLGLWKLDGTDADQEIRFHGKAQIKSVDGYKALYLDGKNTSFATTPTMGLLRRSFSIGAWVKLLKPASSGLIFGDWSSTYQFSVLVNDNGTVSAHVHIDPDVFVQVNYSSIPFNVWVHVMFSWAKNLRALHIRINGKQKALQIVPGNFSIKRLIKRSTQNYYIGLERNRSTVFHGYLRELAVYFWSAEDDIIAAKRIGRWDKFNGVWIGLNDLNKEGNFVYSDGSEVTYKNWNKDEPDDFANFQDCAAILLSNDKYSWSDQPCGLELPFICRKKE
ncbi:uncharacterized protein LOC116288006 [Actinia tenebrosa]|uniref:Uncharacterized protein LOC116288006 n=1 Tax=Actinia tenebrosa TaxID=6105 RepID=A0A6P8HDE2_ACTTE|nr:uncharacterized protein LOC116288006 [Actinia tenebrosa]